MQIVKVSTYRLVFVILFVCTVTDFSDEDEASGVKFCMVVHWRPGQGISHFGELCSPIAQNGVYAGVQFVWGLIISMARVLADSSSTLAVRRIGMCG